MPGSAIPVAAAAAAVGGKKGGGNLLLKMCCFCLTCFRCCFLYDICIRWGCLCKSAQCWDALWNFFTCRFCGLTKPTYKGGKTRFLPIACWDFLTCNCCGCDKAKGENRPTCLKCCYDVCCSNNLCCFLNFKKKAKRTLKENPRDGLARMRVCTDCCCVPIFLLFWVGMIIIGAIAFLYGNPASLIEPVDWEQNMCGWKKGEGNRNNYDLSGEPFLWYPIRLDLDIVKTVNYAVTAYFEGICVRECPKQVYNADKFQGIVCRYDFRQYEGTATGVALVKANNGSCYANNFETGVLYKRCIPQVFDSSNLIATNIAIAYNWILSLTSQFFAEFYNSLIPVAFTSVLTLIFCFLFVTCVALTADIIVFLIITSVFLFILFCCIYCIYFSVSNFLQFHTSNDIVDRNVAIIYLVLGIILLLALLVYLFLLLFIWKRLKLAIGIIKEATKAVWSMPTMLACPFIALLCVGLTCVYCGSVLCYLQGMTREVTFEFSWISNFIKWVSQKEVYIPTLTISRWNIWGTIFFFYNIFGFLWTVAFIFAFSYTVVAMCVVIWYFSAPTRKPWFILSWFPCFDCNRKRFQLFPVTRAIIKVGFFHVGSILFGSLLVAIIQFTRIMVREIEKRLKTRASKAMTILLKLIQILLFIFEQIVKFINKNAYIMICIKSDMFLIAAFKGFILILQNILRVIATNFIGNFILFLGKVIVTLFGAVIAFLVVQFFKFSGVFINVSYGRFNMTLIDYNYYQLGIVPMLVGGLVAFLIGNVFFSVFGTTIDTLLLCFCADIKYCGKKGIPHYYPMSLMKCVGSRETVDRYNREYFKKRDALKKQLKAQRKLEKMKKLEKKLKKKLAKKQKQKEFEMEMMQKKEKKKLKLKNL